MISMMAPPLAWVYTTPFGDPVLPVVNTMAIVSFARLGALMNGPLLGRRRKDLSVGPPSGAKSPTVTERVTDRNALRYSIRSGWAIGIATITFGLASSIDFNFCS